MIRMVFRRFLSTVFFSFIVCFYGVSQRLETQNGRLSEEERARYSVLLHKPYGQSVNDVHAMYKDLIDIPDSTQRAAKADAIKQFAKENRDGNLERNVDFFLVFWNAFFQAQPHDISHRLLHQQLEIASQTPTGDDTEFFRARSLRAMAEFYWKIEKNYEKAFEQYILLDRELAKIKPDNYPEMARDLMQIGEAYYYFQDYDQAGKYFKKAINLPENTFNTRVINAARNTLGLSFQQLGKLDSSDYYFNEIRKTTFPEAEVWKRIATGNLGANLYYRQQFNEAFAMLEPNFRQAVTEGDYGSAAGSAICLADIYRIKGDLKKSDSFISYAKEYIRKSGQGDKLRLLYPVISKWYVATGDREKSKEYVDSAVYAINKYHEKFSALNVLRAQQKIDRQKEELQLAAFALEREQKAAVRNVLILLVLVLCAAIALIYFIQKKRQLSKDLKLQAATQELEITEYNLKMAEMKLNDFTQRIQEKTKLAEEMQLQLQSVSDVQGDNEMLMLLQQYTILTEEDWQDFKATFEQVHTGFFYRLKKKYPLLSPAEIRYLALAKLFFSTKEMAATLGVSTQSIRTNWYRIRKKLDLPKEMTVDGLVAEI